MSQCCKQNKSCSGECGVDCPCEAMLPNSPANKGRREFFGAQTLVALTDALIEIGRPMTLKEAHEAMVAVRCSKCGMIMPLIVEKTHDCTL